MKKKLFALPLALATWGCLDLQAQDLPAVSSTGTLPAAFQSYPVAFSGTSDILRADYEGNATSLAHLADLIETNRDALENGEFRIRVASNVAPAGISREQAYALARRRALVLKSYLICHAGAREAFFSTRATTEGKLPSNHRLTAGMVPVKKDEAASGEGTAMQIPE